MNTATIAETNQYLTFRLDEETFALEISKVREVLDFINITRVPRTPNFMRGVINLRGNVVPVVDMRLNFGMSMTEKTVATCIIIVEVSIDGETTILGTLADSVQEVIEIDHKHIEPVPCIGTYLRTDFIKGIGKCDNGFIMLLDIDKIFSSEELTLVQSAKENMSSEEAKI
ncbi:MAG: chemotaxis protein CheW [Nitrospirota bacterium]